MYIISRMAQENIHQFTMAAHLSARPPDGNNYGKLHTHENCLAIKETISET